MQHIFWGSTSAANAYTLALDCGAYTVTGNAVTLTVQRKLTADLGIYTVTGNAVSLTASHNPLVADLGTYTVTGNDVTLTAQRKIIADLGTYTVTGNPLALTAQRKLTADLGTYTVTGNDVLITTLHSPLVADLGTYTVTGNDVTLTVQRKLTLNRGTYTVTGYPLALTAQLSTLTADSAAVTYGIVRGYDPQVRSQITDALNDLSDRLSSRSPIVGTLASSDDITPSTNLDMIVVTALATDTTFNNPRGTPGHGQELLFRLKDNSTPRAITWDTQYRGIGETLPATTTAGKTQYLWFRWNSTDSMWDLVLNRLQT